VKSDKQQVGKFTSAKEEVKINKRRAFNGLGIIALLLPILLTGGPKTRAVEPLSAPSVFPISAEAQPPIYVSIVLHHEEEPLYHQNKTLFISTREKLVQLADMLHENGAMFNYQPDWPFPKAVSKFDTGTPETNGKNVMRYLYEDLGFEIDPHAHATLYNRADVAYEIEMTGVEPSGISGGVVVSPVEDSILERLWEPITGTVYPTYTWEAEAMWGGATAGHAGEENLYVSGIWKPKSRYYYLAHDDDAPKPAIGRYTGTWEGLDKLLQLQQDGELDPDEIHTCSIFISQGDLTAQGFIAEFEEDLLERKNGPGNIEWVGLDEVLGIWRDEYDSQPNRLLYHEIEKAGASDTKFTYVQSPGVGRIAVRLRTPETPRYPEGAPVVVNVCNFFTYHSGFGPPNQLESTELGAIQVSYISPGEEDLETGYASEGVYDHGGPQSIAALRDVIRFSFGAIPDVDGYYIGDLLATTPLTDNVGVFAFSHQGIAGTNVLCYHGDQLSQVKYFVGRENPTIPALSSLEAGYMTDAGHVLNPYYVYASDYTSRSLNIDYSKVGWLENEDYPDGRPFFAVDDGPDHILGPKIPNMWDKRYYSPELTQALLENGAFTETWPSDLATVTETLEIWPYRTTVHNYGELTDTLPHLKVMLVFARDDHVQGAPDKPHIHHAWDGFRETAGLWVRLNPDPVYIAQAGMSPDAFPDNPANAEPADWYEDAPAQWSYPNLPGADGTAELAGVAEMMDRVQAEAWSDDLDAVLFHYPQPRLFLPLILRQ
jgi:hypothetical protein